MHLRLYTYSKMKAMLSTICLAATLLTTCNAFSLPPLTSATRHITSRQQHTTSLQTTSLQSTYSPVFDFTLTNTTIKQKSASSFERIDDAIMGGISTSSLRDVPDQNYASWSGVCRTDGGGFCGMRTLPFKDAPLNATDQDGVYLDCMLVSDDDADRRMWKMTLRTDSSRGEQVFQAQFDLQKAMYEAKIRGDDTWARVLVPFDSFQLVRGPRLIVDSDPLDVSGGIYQIGMTMSKFKIAVNTTELENFRAGFFNMHIKEIGFYNDNDDTTTPGMAVASDEVVPDTLSKKEAESKRPMLLKMLLPVAKLLFSEKANRRRSAMKIMREKRNMSRVQAILFGIKIRQSSMGLFGSVAKTVGILSVDIARAVVKNVLKIVFLYPLRLIGGIIRTMKKMLGMKVKPSLRE
jgi:hypothetical protein